MKFEEALEDEIQFLKELEAAFTKESDNNTCITIPLLLIEQCLIRLGRRMTEDATFNVVLPNDTVKIECVKKLINDKNSL